VEPTASWRTSAATTFAVTAKIVKLVKPIVALAAATMFAMPILARIAKLAKWTAVPVPWQQPVRVAARTRLMPIYRASAMIFASERMTAAPTSVRSARTTLLRTVRQLTIPASSAAVTSARTKVVSAMQSASMRVIAARMFAMNVAQITRASVCKIAQGQGFCP